MKFLRKPKLVEAMFFDGSKKGANEIIHWSKGLVTWRPEQKAIDGGIIAEEGLRMSTKYGVAHASARQWIVKGSCGLFYPCSEADFKANYEAVPEKDPTKQCVHTKDGVCTFMKDASTREAVVCDGHEYRCIAHLVEDEKDRGRREKTEKERP